MFGIDVDLYDQGSELLDDGSGFKLGSEKGLDLFQGLFLVVGRSEQFHAVGQ